MGVKTVNALALASVKTVDGLAAASVKTINGLATSSGFSPTDVSDLKLWLKADSGLFDAVSSGSAVAADGAVARWEDQSGNANNLTQSTSGSRPLLKTNIIKSSLPVVRFDGSDDIMGITTGSISATENTCIFCVVAPKFTPTAFGGHAFNPVFIFGSSCEGRLCLQLSSNPQYGTWLGVEAPAGTTLTQDTFALLSVIKTSSSAGVFRINKASDGSFSGTWAGQGNGTGTDQLGGETPGFRNSPVDIAELLIYTHNINSTERDNIENYLYTKYF